MLDANNAWSDLLTALAYCRSLKISPYWIEVVSNSDDIENHSRLATLIQHPCGHGRNRSRLLAFQTAIDQKAVGNSSNRCGCVRWDF